MGNRVLINGFFPRFIFVTASISFLSGCGTSPSSSSHSGVDSVFVRPKSAPNSKDSTSSSAEISEDHGLRLQWPLDQHRKMSRGYLHRGRKFHEGLDLPAPTGTPIFSSAGGRVIYSGQAFHGYGKMILIDHSESPPESSESTSPQVATLYGHCSKIYVRSGERVKAHQLIGLVGRTGRATAPHLHFEVRVNRSPVDPMEFLTK